jgi:allophanate hydrolase subunit 1
MRKLVLVAMVVLMASVGFCADITLKGVPDGISEQQVKEWTSILIERYHQQKIQQIPELVAATTSAQVEVDSFRVQNALTPKYEKIAESKQPDTGM